jgi:hypothetical protein
MTDDKRTDSQTPAALEVAAFSDLRQFRKYPSQFAKKSVLEMAETLWHVYLIRAMVYADFDAFLAECVRQCSRPLREGVR